MTADGGQTGEKLQQAGVSVVQMDPHCDSQTKSQVEVGTTVLVEVALQWLTICSDVQRDEGDSAGQRVCLQSSLNQSFIQVEAQEMNLVPRTLFFVHHMFIKGYTQVLLLREKYIQ